MEKTEFERAFGCVMSHLINVAVQMEKKTLSTPAISAQASGLSSLVRVPMNV